MGTLRMDITLRILEYLDEVRVSGAEVHEHGLLGGETAAEGARREKLLVWGVSVFIV